MKVYSEREYVRQVIKTYQNFAKAKKWSKALSQNIFAQSPTRAQVLAIAALDPKTTHVYDLEKIYEARWERPTCGVCFENSPKLIDFGIRTGYQMSNSICLSCLEQAVRKLKNHRTQRPAR